MTLDAPGIVRCDPSKRRGHEVVEAARCRSSRGGRPAPTSVQIQASNACLILPKLVLRRLGVGRVEDALLDAVLDKGVVDLRQGRIERVRDEFAGVTARRAPVRGRGGVSEESADLDRPRGDLDRVIDARRDAEDLFAERGDGVGWYPGRTEPGRDLRGFQVLGQSFLERLDVAFKSRILEGGVDGDLELLADRAGEIGVCRPPGLQASAARPRVEEYAVPELGDRRLARNAEKLGDAVEIDDAGLMRRSSSLSLIQATSQSVGIVEERLKASATDGLADLAVVLCR